MNSKVWFCIGVAIIFLLGWLARRHTKKTLGGEMHREWEVAPPTHPNCRCFTADDIKKDTSDFWDQQTDFEPKWNGIFEDLFKADIKRMGAVIPIHKEKKMEFKKDDKVRHNSGVEGVVVGVKMGPQVTMQPTTKNVFEGPYTGDASEFTKIQIQPDAANKELNERIESQSAALKEVAEALGVKPLASGHFILGQITNEARRIVHVRDHLKESLGQATRCSIEMKNNNQFTIIAKCSNDVREMWNTQCSRLTDKEKLVDEMIVSMKRLEAQKNPDLTLYTNLCSEMNEGIHKRLRCTTQDLTATRKKCDELQSQIKKFKATEHAGMEWEAELRVALGIAGPHTKTVKIIDRVKEICTAKAWAQYEPEIRAKERERIFRKLTNVHIGGIQRGFTMRQGVMIHELEFTEQALSDFLSGD